MKKLIICEKSSLAKGVVSGINTMNYSDRMKTIKGRMRYLPFIIMKTVVLLLLLL